MLTASALWDLRSRCMWVGSVGWVPWVPRIAWVAWLEQVLYLESENGIVEDQQIEVTTTWSFQARYTVDGPLDASLSSTRILSGWVEGGEAGEVEKTPVNFSVVCICRGSFPWYVFAEEVGAS